MNKMTLKEWDYKINLLKLLKSDLKKSDFPKLVVIQSFNRCNCACAMCPYSYTVAKERMNYMDIKLFDKILDELSKEERFETMILAFQNEPLLDKRLIELAQKFKEKMPNKRIELVTNGSLLNKKIAKDVFKLIDIIHVSLNAYTPKTHRIVSNSGHFKSIMKNLNEIAKNPKWQEKTIIRFIKQKANESEAGIFKKHWNSKGFKVFGFDVNDRLKDVKNFDEQIKIPMTLSKKIELKTYKVLGKIILPTCPIPFLCIYIKADGGVVQCFNDWTNANILGNVNEETIRTIFNSKTYKKIRSKLLKDKLDMITICSKCDLYKEGYWMTV